MLAYGAGGRHRWKDLAQAIDQAAFLIDAAKQRCRDSSARVIEQLAYLLRGFDVATEENDAARLDLVDQLTRLGIKFVTRQPDEKELSYLLFKWQRKQLV